MKDILIVSKFTIQEMLRRKSFIISTLVILLMIVLGFNVPNIIKSFNSDDSEASTVLLQDKENLFGSAFDQGIEIDGKVIQKTELEKETLMEQVESGEIDSAIVSSYDEEKNILVYEYIVSDSDGMYGSYIPETVILTFRNAYQANKLSNLNIPEEEITKLYPDYDEIIISTGEEANGNILVMMLSSLVLFYAIFFSANQVSNSITTEKTSKIIETIATSTSPTNIVIGKTLGTGIVGLIQLALIIATAYLTAINCIEKELLDSLLDTSTLTIGLGVVTLIYFVLGYLTYAFIYALTGSTVSKPEDVQAAGQPVAFISMIGFYLSYFTMLNPTSGLNKLASLLPISSPFCMPFRIMMGLASTSDIILSLAILTVTIVIIAYVSIRIYTNAILNYGSRLSVKDLVKMFKQK